MVSSNTGTTGATFLSSRADRSLSSEFLFTASTRGTSSSRRLQRSVDGAGVTEERSDQRIPENSTLVCGPPNSTCSKVGQTLEQHCRMVGMTGRVEWKDPDDGCSRLLYWRILTAETHGIILAAEFFEQLTNETIYIWDTNVFRWTELRLHGVLDIYSNANNLLAVVVRYHSRRQNPARISLRYTSHPIAQMPYFAGRPEGGIKLFYCNLGRNITVPDIWRCDMARQCYFGEDEPPECYYRSLGCEVSWLPYENDCLQIKIARTLCQICDLSGAKPAPLVSMAERAFVSHQVHLSGLNYHLVRIDLTRLQPTSPRLGHLYRPLLQWRGQGGPIAYQEAATAIRYFDVDCFEFSVFDRGHQVFPCDVWTDKKLSVCMKENRQKLSPKQPLIDVSLPPATFTPAGIITKVCSDGSLVHTFHPCPHTDRTDVKVWSEQNLPLFGCTSGTDHVHYTLVCDGNPDCQDGSDENCEEADMFFLPDTMRWCVNRQIVPVSAWCNAVVDCFDNSDEQLFCDEYGIFEMKNWLRPLNVSDTPAPPATVELTSNRGPNITKLSPLEGCKETHFQCPSGYCIPTYTLNNGEKDCFGGEDENIRKESFTCPGFYRCLESESCVHPKYVCDGVPHCLNHDDERYCDLVCPQNCSCEGYAFTCRQAFDYKRFFQVRYLDLSRSWQPSLENMYFMVFLRYLNLSRCGFTSVIIKNLMMLNILDLSDNKLQDMSSIEIENLTGLTHLDLSGNSMTRKDDTDQQSRQASISFTGSQQNVSGVAYFMPSLHYLNLSACRLTNVSLRDMKLLNTLDLSYNRIQEFSRLQLENLQGLVDLDFSGNPLMPRLGSDFVQLTRQAGFNALQTLRIADTGIEMLASRVFLVLQSLTLLDLRGNPVRYLSRDSYQGLNHLRVLRADIARVCCDYFHQGSVIEECDAPRDELSSCEDLLRTDFFRLFLWVFSVLTITGNAGVLIFRLFIEKEGTSLAYRVLVINLGVTDLLMGVYLAIIGSTDAQFRGVYVAEETSWRESNTCKAAGFLSFVSSEVSALTISVITLDRFLVIKFPFNSSIRLTRFSATLISGATWVLGLILAGIPLFWSEFYSQTGICLPLPITRRSFQGQHYAFGVFIICNFALFIVVGVGQTLILYSIHSTAMTTMKGHRQQDSAIARRLLLIVCTDFFCWFPIGLMGLLASSGVPIPGVVNVWAAVFVMPINSSLNPFLYTINSLLDRRGKKMEQQRIEKMMSKLRVKLRVWPPDKVEELFRFCLNIHPDVREQMTEELRMRSSRINDAWRAHDPSEP